MLFEALHLLSCVIKFRSRLFLVEKLNFQHLSAISESMNKLLARRFLIQLCTSFSIFDEIGKFGTLFEDFHDFFFADIFAIKLKQKSFSNFHSDVIHETKFKLRNTSQQSLYCFETGVNDDSLNTFF